MMTLIESESDDDEPLAAFVKALGDGAVAIVSRGNDPISATDYQTVALQMVHWDRVARQHAPPGPPPLCVQAATWGVEVLRFACHKILDRLDTDTALPKRLVAGEPSGKQACHHWSVDLGMRFWADVVRRSELVDALDPLRTTLHAISQRWPLSAIGTETENDGERFEIVWGDASLRRMYVDRVMLRGDGERAREPRVAASIERATCYRNLA